MKFAHRALTLAAIGTVLGISGAPAIASTFTLSNGSGDGSVTLDVDAFGFVKSAIYDPVGELEAVDRISNSGLAIGIGDNHRSFLNLVGEEITREQTSATSASSLFSIDGLDFNLEQTLDSLVDNGFQTGSQLTQTYTITNTTDRAIDFDLVRFLNDAAESSPSKDGGGRLFADNKDFVFTTDTATGTPNDPTFIGISAVGGTIPVEGRYDIESDFGSLSHRITNGEALTDTVRGDSDDGDHFIDADTGIDVSLALNNQFSLDAHQTLTYTTHTLFGDAPESEELEFILTATLEEPNVFGKSLTIVARYFLSQETPDLDPNEGSGLFEISSFGGEIFDTMGNAMATVGLGPTDRIFVEVFNPERYRGSTTVNPGWISGGGLEQLVLDLFFESTTDPDLVPSRSPGEFDLGSFAVVVDGNELDLIPVEDASIILVGEEPQPVPESDLTLGLLTLLGLGWLIRSQQPKG